MKKLQIIKEFQSLIPPLTKEEYDLLEQNILKEGIRDPIIVYGDTIVDGHNRYKIAQEHGLKVDTISKEFNSIDEAKIWIIENQLGRRNIFDFARYELVVEMVEPGLLIMGKEKMSEGGKGGAPDAEPSHNTCDIIAKKLGWCDRKVSMAKFVKQNANLEILQKLREGKISISKVYKKIKKVQKVSKDKEGKAIITKPSSVQNVNSAEELIEELIKYKERSTNYLLEIDNTITNYMENNEITDRDKVINEWLSVAINYYYYIKEEA